MFPKHAHIDRGKGETDIVYGDAAVQLVGARADDIHAGHFDILVFNSAIVDAIKFTYKEPFEPLFEKGAHSGAI